MTMNGPRSGSRELPDDFRLGVGSHKAPGKRMCTMEAVAWIAGLPHSAAPDCASPIITIFVQALNDRMDEERRQHLRRYVPRLIDTCDPRLEPDQARLLASRAIDHFLPAALHDAGHSFFARQLEVADRWPDRQACVGTRCITYRIWRRRKRPTSLFGSKRQCSPSKLRRCWRCVEAQGSSSKSLTTPATGTAAPRWRL